MAKKDINKDTQEFVDAVNKKKAKAIRENNTKANRSLASKAKKWSDSVTKNLYKGKM